MNDLIEFLQQIEKVTYNKILQSFAVQTTNGEIVYSGTKEVCEDYLSAHKHLIQK